ncbi:hypothetical protein V6Z12_A03G037400 [Gossypium hirsutum]
MIMPRFSLCTKNCTLTPTQTMPFLVQPTSSSSFFFKPFFFLFILYNYRISLSRPCLTQSHDAHHSSYRVPAFLMGKTISSKLMPSLGGGGTRNSPPTNPPFIPLFCLYVHRYA